MTKGHLDAEQLRTYGYKDLQALAKEMGVSASGKAEEIIARITAVEVDVPDESELTEEEKAAAAAAAAEYEAEQQAAAEKEAQEQAAAEQQAAAQKAEPLAAGMVRVKVSQTFLDKQLNQIKEAGEVYAVSEARAAELAAAGVAAIGA